MVSVFGLFGLGFKCLLKQQQHGLFVPHISYVSMYMIDILWRKHVKNLVLTYIPCTYLSH